MTTTRFLRIAAWTPLLLVLAIGLNACGEKPADKAAAAPAPRYECPMHPDVNQAEPGKCPKCGMNLMEVVAPTKEIVPHDHDHGADGAHMDHNAKHGGLFGMQGDHHFELVARHGGALTVYVYDAYTKPLDASHGTGSVTLELPGTAGGATTTKVVPLKWDAAVGGFAGSSPDADVALNATIEVDLKTVVLSMTFPLQTTIVGEVVDISCFARLGEQGRGPEHAECAKACILKGMPVGLAVGKTVYVLTLDGPNRERAANEKLADLAGRRVAVTGRVVEVNGLKMLELKELAEES